MAQDKVETEIQIGAGVTFIDQDGVVRIVEPGIYKITMVLKFKPEETDDADALSPEGLAG